MIKKTDLKNNINLNWKISEKKLKEYKYGLCKFIIDKSYELNLSKKIAALAMQIVNYFFIKNCYFNYDKLTVICAALTLAIKFKTSDKTNLNKIINFYISYKKEENGIDKFLSKIEIFNFKNQILDLEIKIMKLFDNSLPDSFPFEYIYLYSKILYPNNDQEMYNMGCKICMDSYFTYANNIYQNYVVALTCIYISAKFLDIKTILDHNFLNIDKMKYILENNMDENKFINNCNKILDDPTELLINEKEKNFEKNKDSYFKSLTLDKKLHPLLKMDDLLECIEIISDFYEEIKANYDIMNRDKKDY